jgi:hypothetical protein
MSSPVVSRADLHFIKLKERDFSPPPSVADGKDEP